MEPALIFFLSFLVSFQLLFVGLFLLTHQKGNPRNHRPFAVQYAAQEILKQ